MNNRRSRSKGFTLVELLVSSMLLTLVFTAVYVTFSSSIRLWRTGEANLQTYQDARTAMSIMTTELNQLLYRAGHLIEGDSNEIEFFAVAGPMDVEESADPVVLWIRYRLKGNPGEKGKILLREERIVESPLPSPPEEDGDIDSDIIEMGDKKSFELAAGVEKFELAYIWVPQDEEQGRLLEDEDPEPVTPVYVDEHKEGTGVPQGLRIALTIHDPNSAEGETTFTSYIVFRGPTTIRDEILGGEELEGIT